MNDIYFIDTCILLEILKVPDRHSAEKSLEHTKKLTSISSRTDTQLIMPISVIIETGNFINHIKNAYQRKRCLEEFLSILKEIKDNKAPWEIFGYEYLQDDLNNIIDRVTTLSPYDVGMGDTFILESFYRFIDRLPDYKSYRVEIWSDDSHLNAYSTNT